VRRAFIFFSFLSRFYVLEQCFREQVVSGAAVLKMTPAEAAALFDELDKNGTGALSREEFSHLNTDELSTQELKAFDAPEELSSAALDQELRALTHPGAFISECRAMSDRKGQRKLFR